MQYDTKLMTKIRYADMFIKACAERSNNALLSKKEISANDK